MSLLDGVVLEKNFNNLSEIHQYLKLDKVKWEKTLINYDIIMQKIIKVQEEK